MSLRAGSYCARVAAADAGENHFVFRYGVGPADPDRLLPEPAPAPETAPAPDSEPESEAVAGVLWSAVMVVGEDELRGDAAFGYSVHTALGSLDSTVLSDGKTVYYLAHIPALGELYLVCQSVAGRDRHCRGPEQRNPLYDPVTVTITVTAPDGITTSVYTVTIRAAPVWQATMTAGEAVNANGYNARSGSLTSDSFDLDGTVYTVSEILAWEFMYITVGTALPEGYVLEVNGSQFALGDADAVTYRYGTVYYWEDAGQIWRRGAQVSLALYPAD